MKIEITNTRPECFVESWPGQYDFFSHYEFTSGVPSILFMITTLKENGKPNACLHAWSTFSGDKGGFYAVMTGLVQATHTFKNILRDREFCINFLDSSYYDNCIRTIETNDENDDEFAAGGFTVEPSKTIKAPRIEEAFLSYECTLESWSDLSNCGISAMIIGKVQHAAQVESFTNINDICSSKAFMLNVHNPKNPVTGEGGQSAIASLKKIRLT